jgi:DNA (cytosine-5)-methyltransferase 1
VWTGSCPCQPYSSAGKGAGASDPRHLWPVWFSLIRERQPATVIGEQVENAIGHGWWDAVQRDLEREGYACGMAVLGAHSVGAPHIRQRLWFVADAPDLRRVERRLAASASLQRQCAIGSGEHPRSEHAGELSRGLEGLCGDGSGGVDDAPSARRDTALTGSESETRNKTRLRGFEPGRADGCVVESPREQVGVSGRAWESRRATGSLEHSESRGTLPTQQSGQRSELIEDGELGHAEINGHEGQRVRTDREQAHGATKANFWANCVWLPCRDGKLRPVERTAQPGTIALADGLSGDLGLVRLQNYPDHTDAETWIYAPLIAKGRQRVGRLRGYGNAIVPQVAAEFISAYMETAVNDL